MFNDMKLKMPETKSSSKKKKSKITAKQAALISTNLSKKSSSKSM